MRRVSDQLPHRGHFDRIHAQQFRLPAQQHRHSPRDEQSAFGEQPRLGDLTHGRVHAREGVHFEQAEHAVSPGRVGLAHLGDLCREPQSACRHHAFRQRILPVPGLDCPVQFSLLIRRENRSRQPPDLQLGAPTAFEHGLAGLTQDLGLPVFLQRHPRHRDEDGHIEQVGHGVRSGGDRGRFGAQRDLPLQHFSRGQHVHVLTDFLHADDHTRREFVGESQQHLLQFDRVNGALVLLARHNGADGLAGKISGAFDHAATRSQDQEQEAQEE